MLHHAVCTSACVVLWFKQFIYIHENMDNQNHCMSIKQARFIVNTHKHNLLINPLYNNGYVCLNNMKTTTKINQKSRKREGMLLCAASNYLIEFVIPWQNDRTG